MNTCPDCGCRVYEYGCVNCDEMEYISMQEFYEPPLRLEPVPERSLNEVKDSCENILEQCAKHFRGIGETIIKITDEYREEVIDIREIVRRAYK